MRMNNRHKRTLAAIFEEPTRANVAWADIESLFYGVGAEVSEGNGSRVRVSLNETRAVFHRPHPRPEIDRGALRSMRTFLSRAGIEPED